MSTPTPTQEPDTENEVFTYIRVGNIINNLESPHGYDVDPSAMKMKRKTSLTKALDSMCYMPFMRLHDLQIPEDMPLKVAGVDAGTLYLPEVDVILEKSTESSFGRGSETILDPSYRRGREIPAANLDIEDIQEFFLPDLETFMFPGRKVEVKLYKLSIYEPGGHFDWHMDSTHSDQHHGTLLLALNTSWEGGNLMLRRNGIETSVDLRPRLDDDLIMLQAIAFFTDTEHRVEPVESGVRVVLQYDVELSKKQEGEDKTKEEGNGGDEEADKGEDEDEDEDGEGENENEEIEPWMDNLEKGGSGLRGISYADKVALNKVLSIIKRLHTEGAKEVAFALQHLYRSASLSAVYLKGSDATLYNALLSSGDFDVSLHPVIFSEETDYEGFVKEHHVYRYDTEKDNDGSPPARKRQKLDSDAATLFHVPELSGCIKVSSTEYIEHTGNEAVPGKFRYFGAGLFVRPKGALVS